MLFVREDAVEAAWAIVDPILANATTFHHYQARGDLVSRTVRLSMWAAGMTPKNGRRVQPLLRAPRRTTLSTPESPTTMAPTGCRPLGRSFPCALTVSHKFLIALGCELVCNVKARRRDA
jgi:hypothetical protein